MKTALALTFHGLKSSFKEPEGILDFSAHRYYVSKERFIQVTNSLDIVICITVSDYVNESNGNWTILTFDDGLITDYEVAFPILLSKGLNATFFINTENIGKSGYVNLDQLREMTKFGMEIASHGLSHRYLVTMSKDEALKEIQESKKRLQDKIGAEVGSFAPVGGHYHKWMPDAACGVGYKAFVTMIPGLTKSRDGFILLKRNHIQSKHDDKYISSLLGGNSRILFLNRLKYYLLVLPKLIFGMDNYDRIKSLISN